MKNLEAFSSAQIRFNNNGGRVSGYYYSMGMRYKVNNWLNAIGEFRLNTNHEENRWRISLGVSAKKEYNKLNLSFRQLLQKDFSTWSTNEYDKIEYQLRSRGEIEYKLKKKWYIAISAEPYISIYTSPASLYRVRYMTSAKYFWKKSRIIELSFIYQTELTSSGYLKEEKFIPSIEYTHKF